MALHTKIGPIPFADGEYVFDVGPLGIRLELEEKCGGIGLLGIHRRLQTDCLIMDYRETIRLGLMGGGMKPLDALKLVKRYVEARPAQESVPLAMMILMAGLVGVEEEKKDDPPLGKQQAETALTGTKPVSPSANQPSINTAPPLASVPVKSTNSRTGNSSSASKVGVMSTPARVPLNRNRRPPPNSTASSKPTPSVQQAEPFTNGK